MSYPTGMGAATGNHYNHVAAQMHSYLNRGGQQNLHPVQGHFHQHHVSHQPAYASHSYHNSGYQMGVNPMIAGDVGDFARRFMRNLFT